MSYWVFIGLSFSILFAAACGIIRFKKTDPEYYPFIFCTWIAAANELLSFFLAQNKISNIPNNNIYVLIEGLLITWQFKKWGYLIKNNKCYGLLAAVLTGVWFYEMGNSEALPGLHFYYRLFYAVVIVSISININNRLIISHKKKLITNPVFLICTGYIIFFTFKILTDAFWLYKIKSSDAFLYAVYFIMAGINFLVNLLFLIAVLWIPRRPHYIKL